MGTRHIVEVKQDDELKVSQYGQWDGYFTGQGKTIADFLQNADIKKFKQQIDQLKEWTKKDIKQAWVDAGADPNTNFVSVEVSNTLENKHPELNRNTGAGILELIHNGQVKRVALDREFKNDELFCEYCYTIDLDNETVKESRTKEYSFGEWTPELMEKLENDDFED